MATTNSVEVEVEVEAVSLDLLLGGAFADALLGRGPPILSWEESLAATASTMGENWRTVGDDLDRAILVLRAWRKPPQVPPPPHP